MDKPYTTFETPPKRTRSSVTIRFIVRVPIFSFIILLWIAENIPAAVPSDHLRLDIGPKTEILKDPQAELTLNRILQSPDTFDFIPNKSKTLPVVDYRTAYWIRFKLPRSAFESSETRFLEVGSYFSRLFDEIDLFIPKNGNEVGYRHKIAGNDRSADDLDVRYRTCLFVIEPDFGEDDYFYLRLRSRKPLAEPLTLWSASYFWQENLPALLMTVAAMGVLLAMGIYNLFILIILMDRVYLYYTLYVVFTLAWQFCSRGFAHIFFHFDPGVFIPINFLLARGSAFFTLIMVAAFLNTKSAMPRLHWLIRLMAFAICLSSVLVLLDRIDIASPIGNGVGLTAPLVLFPVTLIRWRQGFGPAKYMVVAWVFLAGGLVMFFLQNLHWIETDIFSSNGYLFGSALEAVFLSFALADRIRVSQKEKTYLQERERRFQELSITDAMTELYNKRYFDEKLTAEMKLSQKLSQPLSLIMMDVDNFKRFNDTYGHTEGDTVLMKLGRIITDSVRDSDAACRYGGEEFVVILPMTKLEASVDVAERIRKKFAREKFHPSDEATVSTSVSLGVTELKNNDTPNSIVTRADHALYQAKSRGKNQTVAA